MKKHMSELSKLKPEELAARRETLRAEVVELQRSIRLGDTQNYHLATTKRRDLARVEMLLAQSVNSESSPAQTSKEVSAGKKEKK